VPTWQVKVRYWLWTTKLCKCFSFQDFSRHKWLQGCRSSFNQRWNTSLLTYLLIYLLTYSIEKLTGSQLVKIFPAFYGTRKFITHSQVPATYPYLESDRSSPYPHIPLPEFPSWYYTLIYAWVLQVVSFPQVPHQNPVYSSLLLHTCYMPRSSHSSRFYHPNNIGWAVKIIKLLII